MLSWIKALWITDIFGFYCRLLKEHKLERVLSTSVVVNKITYIGF
jgi:hypothetical protein